LGVGISDNINSRTLRADAVRFVLVGQDAQDHSRVAYIHADHLGTPLAMTDKNQRRIQQRSAPPQRVEKVGQMR